MEVTFDWDEPPELPDAVDPGQSYALGLRWTLLVDAPIPGVEWQVPQTLPSGLCAAALWSDAGSLLAAVDFTPPPESAGQRLKIHFDGGAYPGVADTVYRASVFTPDRYVATTNYGWPVTIPGVMATTSDNGYLTGSAAFPAAQSGNSANFHVSPIVQLDQDETTAELDAMLPALTAAVAGRAAANADLVAVLPALVAAAAGDARGHAALAAVLPALTGQLAGTGTAGTAGLAAVLPALRAALDVHADGAVASGAGPRVETDTVAGRIVTDSVGRWR
ncbi:hypothetical protein C1I95_21775 [Micromonospora craterilacus]|uniref:DUF4082 domain-containing protein n=1 Tax=Micromonospora craterilacus TaxID=1655439 RepID=A0A2W2DV94_9ACTN|nr:DUF4082 domain-containing protein [Micromonospora craterilacus]PZG14423.1 hypothetical protein C1I95_21775 [Micromonospora craterilacus]